MAWCDILEAINYVCSNMITCTVLHGLFINRIQESRSMSVLLDTSDIFDVWSLKPLTTLSPEKLDTETHASDEWQEVQRGRTTVVSTYHAIEDILDCTVDVDGWEILQDVADGSSTVHEPHIIFTATSCGKETEIMNVSVRLNTEMM